MSTDEITVERVWSEYRSRLRSFLQSRISDPADVDDLLQEVLIKAHQNLATLRSADSLKSWLFQIAQNAIVSFYRARRNSEDIRLGDLWYNDPEGESQTELERCVAPFVEALPERERSLLKAIDLDGQSQKEYASAQRISYSTLKSRVKKARERLRKSFDDCCQFSFDQHGRPLDYRVKSNQCENC